jgi:hypothetical protein
MTDTSPSSQGIDDPMIDAKEVASWLKVSEDWVAFIFPNRDGGVRDPNNYRKRVLGELRKKLNLPKLTFQIIRRTMATLSQTKERSKIPRA